MKRSTLIFLSLLLGLILGSCFLPQKTSTSPTSEPITSATVTTKEATSPVQTTSRSTTVSTTSTPANTTVKPTAPVQTTSASSTAATTTATQPTGPKMFSSYAFLVAFDPSSNLAQFDYFDMLTGQEAVDFLVKYEDYSKDEAQDLVDNFADSEFVISNLNDQLREIDLAEVSLSLMYQPSGDMSEIGPIPASLTDFKTIYELDPLLLLESFFFYIDVADSGQVILVEQVYWP